VVFSLRRATTHRHPIPLPSKTPESERPFIAHSLRAPACVYRDGGVRTTEEDDRPDRADIITALADETARRLLQEL